MRLSLGKRKSSRQRTKGIMTLAAGFVLQLINGSSFAVGSIAMYIYSYFPVASFSETQEIFPIMMIVGPIANFICSYLIRQGHSNHVMIFLGASVMIVGLFVSSLLNKFDAFVPIFSFSFGFGGFFYSAILP